MFKVSVAARMCIESSLLRRHNALMALEFERPCISAEQSLPSSVC